MVSGAQCAHEIRAERIEVAAQMSAIAERRDDALHIPPQIGRRIDPHRVGRREGRRQRLTMHAHAHGLGSRLKTVMMRAPLTRARKPASVV